MNIQELLKATGDTNITLAITPADLKEFALAVVEALRDTETQQPKEDNLFTPPEAAKFLGKSLSTLWRWQKTGYLVPDGRIGQQTYYLQSTLENLGKEGRR